MSDACFIADLGPATSGDQPLAVGDLVEITGSEAHHAAVVRRIEVGESVLVTNGQGLAVRGPVVGVAKRCVQVRVAQTLRSAEHAHRWVAVQALAKGD
ncbi:MAG: RNA methyltransferase PUA domain-containing protein, partial [Propionibacterium sp.]|nr:RNA methyltransferase PUA domain-containing protein [Propionibacterium sp.]